VLARQKAILGDRKPGIHLVIGEAALHQQIGGPQVMEGQLGLLSGISGDSGVITVQVLPFTSGAHAVGRCRSRHWRCRSGSVRAAPRARGPRSR
jgi:Domain of unknown function (DUF5753)